MGSNPPAAAGGVGKAVGTFLAEGYVGLPWGADRRSTGCVGLNGFDSGPRHSSKKAIGGMGIYREASSPQAVSRT